MGVGCSRFTREKWERFEHLLVAHLSICREIMPRFGVEEYAYLDFYAGPGIYASSDRPDLAGEAGSPIRAMRLMATFGMSSRAYLFDPEEAGRLLVNVGLMEPPIVPTWIDGLRCREAVDRLIAGGVDLRIGLAFFDPNGQADWPAIGRFAAKFRYIDLLININSAVIKRMINPIHRADRPMAYLEALGKKYVYLWDPCPSDPHQFALAFCTNFADFPESRALGFHRSTTPQGRCIARRIDHSHRERESLGGVPGFLDFGGEHVY